MSDGDTARNQLLPVSIQTGHMMAVGIMYGGLLLSKAKDMKIVDSYLIGEECRITGVYLSNILQIKRQYFRLGKYCYDAKYGLYLFNVLAAANVQSSSFADARIQPLSFLTIL